MKEMNEKIQQKIDKKISSKKDSHKLRTAERIDSSVVDGLTLAQVEERKQKNLVNKKSKDNTKSYFKIFSDNLLNFCNIIVLSLFIILIAIGAGDYTISSSIIFINIGIGIWQEIKAKKAISKLSFVTQSQCEVVRESKSSVIPVEEIVLDDIIILQAGQQIPVDGEVVKGVIEVDESIITGETIPVKKDETTKVLAGSNIISGQAAIRANRVGKDCYISGISRIAQKLSKPKSDIFKTLDSLIKGISVILVVLAIFLLIAERVATTAAWNQTIITVASSMLGMIPVGMFLLTSTALAASTVRLTRKHALPQDLYSVEMLARVDTLLLDKTGTITDGHLEVLDEYVLNKDEHDIKDILMTIDENTKDKKPTACALKEFAKEGKALECIDVLPFNSQRKYSAVTLEDGTTYILGAPDFICAEDQKVQSYCNAMSTEGKRTILIARCDSSIDEIDIEKTIPLSVFAIEEKIKEDVKQTLEWFRNNDVDIKIVSGDAPQTVYAIAQKAGVYNADQYVNCAQIKDEELDNCIDGTTVFGRVSPEQKVSIVKSLQDKGHVVGMIGDGVNDVQALKASDCSISFANANDVARNISRIVLLDNNFKSMPNIVEEGRRVIANVEKVSSLYIMKNIFVMFMTLIFAIITIATREQQYPFDTKKMMLIEFFVIGVPTFIYALLPNQARVKGNFLRNILKSSFPSAIALIVSTGFILILTNYLNFDGIANVENYKVSMATFALTMSGFAAVLIISMPPNKIRLGVLFVMIGCSILGVYLDGVIMEGTLFDMQLIGKYAGYIILSTLIGFVVNLSMRYVFNKLDLKYGEAITNKFDNFVEKVKNIRSRKKN